MVRRRSVLALALAAVVLLVLSGCYPSMAPVRPLVTDGTLDAAYVAVAVEADGTQHFAWSEAGTGSRLVYWEGKLGNKARFYAFTPEDTGLLPAPEIAVTDDGTTVIVWRKTTIHGTFPYIEYVSHDCYTVIPSATSRKLYSVMCTALAGSQESAGQPTVAARGKVVYAVYEVPLSGGATALRYRQILPTLDASGGSVSRVGSTFKNTRPSAAVDETGKLHVVWADTSPTTGDGFYMYADNVGTTGDMSTALVTTEVTSIMAPQVAIAGSGASATLYAVLGTRATTSDTSDTLEILHCDTSSCITARELYPVPLATAEAPWKILGDPRIAASTGANTAYLAFSASNLDTGSQQEVWHYAYQPSSPATAPTRVTTNAWVDGPPRIVLTSDVPVVGWRKKVGDYYRDAYVWDPLHGLRQVFTSPRADVNWDSMALASNGDWVVGIWPDDLDASSLRIVPWVAYNVKGLAYLPLTLRN